MSARRPMTPFPGFEPLNDTDNASLANSGYNLVTTKGPQFFCNITGSVMNIIHQFRIAVIVSAPAVISS